MEFWFSWVIMPLLIFLARLTDVSIATTRTLLVARGVRKIAPFIGFIESLIWIIAISQIMQHLENPLCYIMYAGGYAMGIFVGMKIEERLAMGTIMVRLVTNERPTALIEYLRSANYGTTLVDAHGYTGEAYILFTVIRRKNSADVLKTMNDFHPHGFYTTEDIKMVDGNVFSKKE
jgi:uncharacterized protein YebE (UPF0316 family)